MKKVFSGVTLVLILISILTLALNIGILSQANPETILYIDPSVIKVSVRNGFSINVTVKDVVDLFAFDLCLGYNTTVLNALTVIVLPPFNRGPIFPPIINDTEGYLRARGSLLPGEPGLFGSFPLATITFNATSLGNSTLHLYNTNLVDSTSNLIPHISIDGSITVTGPTFHQISITHVTFSTTSPKINETITISVTVQNSGHFTETFDVSVNYTLTFDPLIGTQTITLTPGETITLNFTWTPNATGRYEIKAYTNTIPDDIDSSDNTRITYLYVSATYPSSSSTEENPWTDIDFRGGRFYHLAYPI